MGKNIKRLSLALLALGLSAPVFADTGSPFAVTVPNQQGGFSFGADALYMKPSATNTNYFVNFGTPALTTTTTSFSGSNQSADPNWNWGFDAFLGYRIPGTGNDVTLTWTHLCQKTTSDSSVQPGVTIPGVTVFGIPLPATTLNPIAATASSTFKYDAVDLDLGQKVNFGDQFLFKMFAGVRFARIEQDLDSTYGTVLPAAFFPTTTTAALNLDQTSKFSGAGPRIGFSGRYCFGQGAFGGFGLDANVATSLLIGSTDSSINPTFVTTTFTGNTATGSTVISGNVDSDMKCHVVPAVDANLGLDYTYNFNNCDRSSLVIQAGYKVINYWDVTQFPVGNGGLLSANNATSVGFHGPYAGVTVNL